MKTLRLPLLLAALPLVLSACASSGPAAAGGHKNFTLTPMQRVDLGGQATLVYDSFSDSRCPESMKCIWAGELVYRFTLATPKVTESFALGSAKPDYVSQALGGAHIRLDQTKAPAVPPAGVAPRNYPVTLTVSP
jgi:hypothetical protein